MHHTLLKFVNGLSSAANSFALREAMANAAQTFDLNSFAYLSMPHRPKASPQLISTYPSAWTEFYLRKKYENCDPVVARALSCSTPFEWGLGVGPRARSKSQQELFEEAACYGICYGFTVPIHDSRGSIAAMTFATDKRRPKFERSIKENARVLQSMAIYFHAHAVRKLTPNQAIDGISLSLREFECLEWASQGKSAWEIGRILRISRHTAAFHLDNAKAKLGVRTLIQAVARLAASNSSQR